MPDKECMADTECGRRDLRIYHHPFPGLGFAGCMGALSAGPDGSGGLHGGQFADPESSAMLRVNPQSGGPVLCASLDPRLSKSPQSDWSLGEHFTLNRLRKQP